MQTVRVMSLLFLLAGFASAATLSFDENDAKNRPVSKVVTLLKDMQKTLEAEGEADEEIYEKMLCWCTTNDKDKTKGIDDGEAHADDLTTMIEEGTAASARLNQEIKTLEGEVAKNQEALDKATAMRQKELAEFQAEEKDMLEALGALTSAIKVLSKHHESLLETGSVSGNTAHLKTQVATALSGLQKLLAGHKNLLREMVTISPRQKKMLSSYLDGASGDAASYSVAHFLQTGKQVPSAGSYAPASGQIFGILKQMKEEFEGNLAASQKEETANQAAYEELKAAKEAEIAAGQEQIETKTQELATVDEKLAADKEDLSDTEKALLADREFLANLKEHCANFDQEFENRKIARQEEIVGVGKALAILTDDDAMDTFSRTFSFAQMKAEAAVQKMKSSRRNKASSVLEAAAKKFQNPRLSQLASSVRLDAFTKVKKAIDDMIAELMKQKEDEIKKKDYCVDEMNANEKTTELKNRDKDDLNAKIEDLTNTITTLTNEIQAAKDAIKEMQMELKRAGEDREKENKEFQTTVADQRATATLLTKALNVLKKVYEKKAALLQKNGQPAGPPPPPGFKAYKKNAQSGGVMGMMQQIIDDAKAMEAEAIKDETAAQEAYEGITKDTNKSVNEKVLEITNKGEEKGKAEAEKAESEQELAAVMKDLEDLANEDEDLHAECDYTLKNFEIRQTARDQEIEALKQAKAILSGAKFSAFLQSIH